MTVIETDISAKMTKNKVSAVIAQRPLEDALASVWVRMAN